jgi:tRNA pseudouridine55 synthase
MNGLLIVDKPSGMTSHDVVNAVRRIVGARRVGHTGTLDPMATGVLVVLVGPSTRLARFLAAGDKTYRAVIRLGEATTTYDAEGEVTERRPVTVELAAIETALEPFRGAILQMPPMYSAIKVGGKKLYQLARQGKQVAREPRPVTMHRLVILDWVSPDLTVDVTCSAGTYIRSLAHDLGQALGCGAHLRALARTATGPFCLEESHALDELRRLAEAGRLAEVLLPPKAALYALPTVHLSWEQVQAVRYGQDVALVAEENAGDVQARDPQDCLVAVLTPVGSGQWHPELVLLPEGN